QGTGGGVARCRGGNCVSTSSSPVSISVMNMMKIGVELP
ncbi:hypothetical protein A2U01_0082892, partial [Trifolium medium]|nr:hypothetical protein [Trifolium medium]